MISLPAAKRISPLPAIEVTERIRRCLALDDPVAIGVSGGKDSTAVAFATIEFLDQIKHKGPRLLVHADLKEVEWQDSLPQCRRLSEVLNVPLDVVERAGGGLMARWEQRHRNNQDRWLTLQCVKMILPWSTPSMRFCTSEAKVDQITRHLKKKYPGRTILNVTGIRREESTERSRKPVCQPQKKLEGAKGTSGLDWHPILDWTIGDVLDLHTLRNFPLHAAYTKFGSSRVSCVACILATQHDHLAASTAVANWSVLERMIRLEIVSTFSFQGSRWLGDTLRHMLMDDMVARLVKAKETAKKREVEEARIPKELLFSKGWPTFVPSKEQASLLADVRKNLGAILGLMPHYVTAESVIARYRELLAVKAKKDKKV